MTRHESWIRGSLLSCLALAACGDARGATGGSDGATDGDTTTGGTTTGGDTAGTTEPTGPGATTGAPPGEPHAVVEFPPFDVGISADAITVRGRIDAGAVVAVNVNGVPAALTLDPEGNALTWIAEVPLVPGANAVAIELLRAGEGSGTVLDGPTITRWDGSASQDANITDDKELFVAGTVLDPTGTRLFVIDGVGDGVIVHDLAGDVGEFVLYTELGRKKVGQFDGGGPNGTGQQLTSPSQICGDADGARIFGRDGFYDNITQGLFTVDLAADPVTGEWFAVDATLPDELTMQDVHIQAGSGPAWESGVSDVACDTSGGRVLVTSKVQGAAVILAIDMDSYAREVVVAKAAVPSWPGSEPGRLAWSNSRQTLYMAGIYADHIYQLDLGAAQGSYLVADKPLGDVAGTQYVVNLAFDEARDRVAAWVEEPAALIVVDPDDGAQRQVLSDAAHGRGEVPLGVIDVDAGPGWYALVDADCQTTECIQGTGPGFYRAFIIDAVSGDRAVAHVWRKFVF